MKIFIIGGCVGSDNSQGEGDILKGVVTTFSKLAQQAGHDIIVCSPFEDSADYFAAQGASQAQFDDSSTQPHLEFHFPKNQDVRDRVKSLIDELKLSPDRTRLFHHSVENLQEENEGTDYSWLLSQINALDSSDVVMAIGGRIGGSASLLLGIALSRRKAILPLPFLSGAASQVFSKLEYELKDKLGDSLYFLNEPARVESYVDIIESLTIPTAAAVPNSSEPPTFFISYARSRPEEADYVEALLRRRNFTVFRDEKDFSAGTKTFDEICQYIHRASIFIAIWSQDYACSPWCFDELDLALDRHSEGKQELWILNVDGTRIVPPKARDIIFLNGRERFEIEASLLRFLNQIQNQ